MAFWTSLITLAAAASASHIAAARAPEPPKLDGHLDDAVWRLAPASDAFTQKVPHDGKPPAERTVVRVLYDDHAVYVGVDCIQTGADVVARLTRRDRQVEADWVSIAFDSRGDKRTSFEFVVNAAGVLADRLHFNDTETSDEWDEIWESRVARTKVGWSAEFRIPLRILRFKSKPKQSWGFQVRRYTSLRQELDEWAYSPRDAAGEVSRYGSLDGLMGLREHGGVELRPFIAGGVRHDDPQRPLPRGFFPTISGGLDLKWHLSQELTLDASLLPDFGQVEADQVVLNLSNFEQYYPEKRPFFLEGVDTFTTPLQLLYTRRIGRVPPPPYVVENNPIRERLIAPPDPAPIVGAAKLVGELGGGVSVGELFAVVGRRSADAVAQNGTKVSRLAEPLTVFKVARVKKQIGEKAEVGLIALLTNRLEDNTAYPVVAPGFGQKPYQLCPDGSEVALGGRCFHDSYVLGVDGRWRSPGGDYTIRAQAIGTLIKEGPERTFADGTVIKSDDVGPAALVRVAKEGGEHVIGQFTYDVHGKKTDYNDLGYMQRQNQHQFYLSAEYRRLKPWAATLETHTGIDVRDKETLSFLTQWRHIAVTHYSRFKNFWGIYSEVHYVFPRFDDREMGDGAALERAGLLGLELYAHTDPSKRVNGELWTQVRFHQNGAFTCQGDGRLTVRVLPALDVDLLPSWIYTTGEPRNVGSQNDRYLFGRQRAEAFGLTLRSTLTFSPRLTLQAYAQLFVESLHYSDFTSSPLGGQGTVVRLKDLQPLTFGMLQNPDYLAGVLNTSLVLRWEYLLGSTLFVVYTHAQSDTILPRFGDPSSLDFRLVKPRPASDALLFKLSYWWG